MGEPGDSLSQPVLLDAGGGGTGPSVGITSEGWDTTRSWPSIYAWHNFPENVGKFRSRTFMFLHKIGPSAACSRAGQSQRLAGELVEGLHGDPLDTGLARRCS